MKATTVLAVVAVGLFLAAQGAAVYASSNAGSPLDPGPVAFPSTNPFEFVSGPGASGEDTVTFTLTSTTDVNIFVGDGYITGDQYLVTLDGSSVLTTSYIPSSEARLTTYLDGCSQASDAASSLSWGDVSVTVGAGTHTLVIEDISTFAAYPAGFCLILSAATASGVPQFPLGLPLLLAVSIAGLLLVRKRVLGVPRPAGT
jgi:hypothetical protein